MIDKYKEYYKKCWMCFFVKNHILHIRLLWSIQYDSEKYVAHI